MVGYNAGKNVVYLGMCAINGAKWWNYLKGANYYGMSQWVSSGAINVGGEIKIKERLTINTK
jgi:hypothetical protein